MCHYAMHMKLIRGKQSKVDVQYHHYNNLLAHPNKTEQNFSHFSKAAERVHKLTSTELACVRNCTTSSFKPLHQMMK